MERYILVFAIIFSLSIAFALAKSDSKKPMEINMSKDLNDGFEWKSQNEDFWRKRLTPEQFRVCRGAGTECAFSGDYAKKGAGIYHCVACGNRLFDSGSKFDSGTGWPSFYEAVPGSVEYLEDNSLGMDRIEVKCSRCGSHLGHVFDDGPKPTGKRYCINSVCLKFMSQAK